MSCSHSPKENNHVSPVKRLKRKRKRKQNVTDKPALTTFINIDKFKSLEDFSKEIEKYCQQNKNNKEKVEGKEKVKGKKRKLKTEKEYCKPSSSYVSESTIYSALQKCVNNSDFWSKDGFEMLLTNNVIILGVDDDVIFDCVLKYNAFSSLKTIAKCMNTVPEKYIIRIIKQIISMVKLDEIKQLHSVSNDTAINISYVILLPVNKVSLREYLKLLTADETLVLFQVLLFLLHAVSPALADESFKTISFEITESEVMVWIDALLTAHLTSFATSSSLHAIVLEIMKIIEKQKIFYHNIAQLGPYLRHFKESKKHPDKLISKYTIEKIKL